MWLVKIIEVLFEIDLSRFGIYPLTAKGLPGILFSPFIHADFTHLFNNSVPLFFSLDSPVLFLFGSGIKGFYLDIFSYRITCMDCRKRSLAYRCKRTCLRACIISFFQWDNTKVFQTDCIIAAYCISLWINGMGPVSREYIRMFHGNRICLDSSRAYSGSIVQESGSAKAGI